MNISNNLISYSYPISFAKGLEVTSKNKFCKFNSCKIWAEGGNMGFNKGQKQNEHRGIPIPVLYTSGWSQK